MDALLASEMKGNAMVAAARKGRSAKAPESRSLSSGGYGYGSSRDQERSKKQYNLNTGWTFAAIRPIAVRCAKQPYRVGKMVKSKEDKTHLKKMLPDFLKGQMSEDHDMEVQKSHPLLEVLADPNEFMTEWTLKFVTAASMQLAAKAFWWMKKSKRTKYGIDIWPVPAHWVEASSRKGKSGWLITPPGASEGEFVSSDEMAYFYYPDPANPFFSRGPMDAAQPVAETSDMILAAQRATFDNIVVPTTLFITGKVPGDDGKLERPELTTTQRNEIEQSLRQLYRPLSKHARMMVLDRIIEDVKLLNQKPMEMDFQESGTMTKEQIMQIFGVNEIVAGSVQNANRAAATVATEGFLDNVVNPLLTLMSQVINQWVMPLFSPKDSKLILWIEEAKAMDQEGRRADLQFLANLGGLLVDEARREYGYPPLPNGLGQVVVRPAMLVVEPIDGSGPLPPPQQQDQFSQNAGDEVQSDHSAQEAADNGKGYWEETFAEAELWNDVAEAARNEREAVCP